MLAAVGIEFSNRYNARFGQEHFLAMLALMCKNRITANKAIADMQDRYKELAPSYRWFIGMLARASDPDTEKKCRQALAKTIRMAIKARHIPRLVITAIDFHTIPFTGKTRDDNVVPGKPKGGTSRFEGYATIAAVSIPHVLQIGAVRMHVGITKAEYVMNLISQMRATGLRSSVHLMDKEFCTVDVIRALDRKKEKFLMAIKRSPGVNKAILEFKAGGRGMVSRYSMRTSDGTTVSFWLVICKRLDTTSVKRQFKYLTYATNVRPSSSRISLDKLIDMYSKRWAEENGYKSTEAARARTGGLNHDARTFLFFFSLIQCNLWCMSNLDEERINPASHKTAALYTFMFALLHIIDEIIGPP